MAKKIGEVVINVSFTVPVTEEELQYMKVEGITESELTEHTNAVMKELLEEIDSNMEGLVIESKYKGEAING